MARITTTDRIFCFEHLRVLLRAGVPAVRALRTIADGARPAIAADLTNVTDHLERGAPLAEAFAAAPRLAPPVAQELLRAGEATGSLERTLEDLVTQLKKEHTLRIRVQSALLYPSIVLGAMLALGVVIVVFVLPRLLSLFTGVNVPLPLATRILIALAAWLQAWRWVVLAGIITTVGAAVLAVRTPKGRAVVHRFLLQIPRIGALVRSVSLVRVTRLLAGLLRSEVPLPMALELTAGTVRNVHYQAAFRGAAERVRQGEPLSRCLEAQPDLFPLVLRTMVTIGEESAAIDQLLAEYADFLDAELDDRLRNLTAIIEPVLILIIGAGVGVLAVAVLMPMYSIAQAI